MAQDGESIRERHGTARHGTARHGTARHGTARENHRAVYNNLASHARIAGLAALLILVQACGGGGGGSSTLTAADCAANEFFVSSTMMCRDRVATDCATGEVFVSGTMTCRDREAADCTDPAMPVLGSDGACRARGAGGGTTAISLAGTDVVFDETITPAQTNAYDEIFDAARNEPEVDFSAQSGNCGAGCMNGQTADSLAENLVDPGGGAPLVLMSVGIDTNGDDAAEYLLDQDTDVIPALARREATMDRRFRPGEGLDGWDYRRFALTGTATASGDTSTAEADLIVWSDEDDGYYLAGGVWAYDIGETTETRGAGLIQGTGDDISPFDPFPSSSSGVANATYTGHSFGYYATLPAPAGAANNRGYFAANAELIVDFTNPMPGESGSVRGVSGTISNFLFSTDKEFGVGDESPLEGALSGLEVTLESGSLDTTGSPSVLFNFAGTTRAEVEVAGVALTLTGRYGGVFIGPQETAGSAAAPLAVGGTWGAAGTTTTEPARPTTATGGFGISFIGAFGAKR